MQTTRPLESQQSPGGTQPCQLIFASSSPEDPDNKSVSFRATNFARTNFNRIWKQTEKAKLPWDKTERADLPSRVPTHPDGTQTVLVHLEG